HHLANYRIFTTSTGDKRLVRKGLALPLFVNFVSRTIKEHAPDIIGCSFWDTALATSLSRSERRIPVVYDVLDMPGGSGSMLILGRLLERFALRNICGV